MKFIPKEISWLSFNERILHEATDLSNPIYERIRFLGIYSNNMDEFFRVRVATLKRLSLLGMKANKILGYSPKTALTEINKLVLKQHYLFSRIYRQLIRELKHNNIFIVNEEQLTEKQKVFAEEYFINAVRPHIMPILINQMDELPHLEDNIVYLAVHIKPSEISKKDLYAMINLPSDILPRFIQLPSEKPNSYSIIFLDDIIRFGLINIFYQFNPKSIEAYTIKITRDAELDITDDISENYVEKVLKGIQKRKLADPVRFIYDSDIPPGMLKVFLKKLTINRHDTIIPGERYHNLKDLLEFPHIGIIKKAAVVKPIQHTLLPLKKSVIQQALTHDILLYFPYHSFNHFVDLLREASINPMVKSIQITLYRLANPSNVINALINAARNGKKVTAILELQARFDEQNNIHYATLLRNEGVKVHLGVPGLKVHAKLCLIELTNHNKSKYISCIGTGNFNGKTSKYYTDLMLITSNAKIANETLSIIKFIKQSYQRNSYYHLIVSPFNMRQKLERLINNEIKNAQHHKPAYIDIKINNLTDNKIIEHLYKAAKAGVKIRLNVRGMCSLMPDNYPNIEVIGILDFLLEHSRIIIFCNHNEPKYYIGSADLMARNLDTRVEALCPIYDDEIQKQLRIIFECSWNDNQKARIINDSLSNKIRNDGPPLFRSQTEMSKIIRQFGKTNI